MNCGGNFFLIIHFKNNNKWYPFSLGQMKYSPDTSLRCFQWSAALLFLGEKYYLPGLTQQDEKLVDKKENRGEHIYRMVLQVIGI